METVLLTSGVLAAGYYTSKNFSRDYASVDNQCKPFDDVYSAKIIDPSVEQNIVEGRLNDKNIISENHKKVKSLTGDYISTDNFKHNNMVPFFGSQAPTSNDMNANKTILETFTGVGDYKQKQEQTSFFDLEKYTRPSVQSTNNEYQSRMNSSKFRQGEKPFQSDLVGPGLNLGYTTGGAHGFHPSLAGEYSKPKTVDELRVKTNPKVSYKGRTINGSSIVSKREEAVNVEKNRPDTFYVNSKDRYNKTTGAFKKDRYRSKQVQRKVRANAGKSYQGIAGPGSQVKTTSRSEGVKKTTKTSLSVPLFSNAVSVNKWKNYDDQRCLNNKTVLPNERDTTQLKTHTSNLTSLVKAIISPIEDIMRSSRKENVVGNGRAVGNVNGSFKKQTVHDPNDIAKRTLKETNIHDTRSGALTGPKKLTIHDPNDIAKRTIKETNIHDTRTGALAGPKKLTTYDPTSIAKRTIKETNIHNNTLGNAKLPNKETQKCEDAAKTTVRETLEVREEKSNLRGPRKLTTYDPNDVAKRTIKETNIHDNRDGNIGGMDMGQGYLTHDIQMDTTSKELIDYNEVIGIADGEKEGTGAYDVIDVNAPETNKQFTSDYEYMGTAEGMDKQMSYADIYNATMNEVKQDIAKGRVPTATGTKQYADSKSVNMQMCKTERKEDRETTSKTVNLGANQNNCGVTRFKPTYKNDDRMTPEMVSAFKNNPYTQSLHSAV